MPAEITTTELAVIVPITAFIAWWLYSNLQGGAYLVITWIAILLIYNYFREGEKK